MTALSDIFRRDEQPRSEEAYRHLGYPRNPFRLPAGEEADENAPFYTGHILQQLHQLRQWIAEVHGQEIRPPYRL